MAAAAAPLLPAPPAAAIAPAAPASAPAMPSISSADVTQAISQHPRAAGAIAVTAKPEPAKPMIAAAAEKKKSVLVWHVERPVEWRGEKFKLKIEIPLPKPLSEMDENEKLDFKHAANQFADLFVQDLLKNLEPLKSQEAEIIRICFFDGNQGYAITTDENYNPLDPKSAEDKDVVFAKDKTSVALSSAITNEKRTANAMRTALQAEELAPLRKTAEKQNAEKSKTLAPAGFIWKDNSCFIHAALYHLLEEPTIADDLANPANYEGGEANPLFRVVQRYRQCQESGEPFDAASILREEMDASGDFRDALEDGWQAFEGFFNFENIPDGSHLRSLFSNPVHILLNLDESSPPQELNTVVNDALRNKKPADVFSIQVEGRRLDPQPKVDEPTLSEGLTEDLLLRRDFLKTLKEKIETADNDNEHAQLLKALISSSFVGGEDEDAWDQFCGYFNDDPELSPETLEALKKIADTLLDDKNSLCEVLSLLDHNHPHKVAINDYRKQNFERFVDRLNPQPLSIDPSGQLTIQGEAYDISSFTIYQPGHFITFTLKDGIYYKLDDLSKTNKVEVISKEKFLEAGQLAYFYTVRKASLTPAPASADAAQAQKPVEPALKPNKPVVGFEDPIRTDGSSVDIVLETGSMKAAGNKFVLVNPSDSGLRYLHKQLVDDVMDEDQFAELIKTETAKDKRWYDSFGADPHTARGQGWSPLRRFKQDNGISSGPRPLMTRQKKQRIIHVPLPSLTSKDDVAQAITDTLDHAKSKGITHVAFPQLDYRGDEVDGVVPIMVEVIQEYLKSHDWRSGHIKIILPEAAGAA